MSPQETDNRVEMAQLITEKIKEFTQNSPLNRLPAPYNNPIFDEPLVQFADGGDPLFTEYKRIIGPVHLTPREALARTLNKKPEDLPARLSVISWILPIVSKIRVTNRSRKLTPSRLWSYNRWYGEIFNEALRAYVVKLLRDMGYLAAAPSIEPYFKRLMNEKGRYSNWSERHVAYAAGLGTFSLSDGFITERGIAHRCGSVVTDLVLPPSPRTATGPYSNCLFYVNRSCRACIIRCPGEAISESGHDKIKCSDFTHAQPRLGKLQKTYGVEILGCGLCQTKVPCEAQNPTRKLKKKAT